MVRPEHFWSAEANEEFKELWMTGVHIYDMALHFGIHEANIRARRIVLGLPNRKISQWTKERVQYVRDNWEHSSASVIGAKLNTTRNAVIGLSQRLGLAPKRIGRKGSGHPRPQRNPALIRPPAALPQEPFSWPELPSLNIPFLDLEKGQCRFPCDEGFCGNPVVYQSYCGPHARLCYRPHSRSPADLLRLFNSVG